LNFPSKRDIWYLLVFGILIFLVIIGILEMNFTTSEFIDIIVLTLSAVLLLWIWFGTGYKIENHQLKIKFGPIRSIIEINDIKKINKVKSPFTAPALSIDRLEILYGKYDVISISPKNEHKFIQLLINENPQIQIDEKLSKILKT
jgi:hypothetical protein